MIVLSCVCSNISKAFPNATVHGVDSSKEMVERAKQTHTNHTITFSQTTVEEVVDNVDGGKYDIIYSNAALHWVLNHETILPRLVKHRLLKGGIFAFQIPDTRVQPSHTLMVTAAKNTGYYDDIFVNAVPPVRIPRAEQDPLWYQSILSLSRNADINHWNTEYVHQLPLVTGDSSSQSTEWPAEHPVCTFTKATGLMPIIDALKQREDGSDISYYEEYNRLLYDAYPPYYDKTKNQYVVFFTFRRYFCTAYYS